MNVFDIEDTNPNEGFNKRVEMIQFTAPVDMIGRPHADLFHQERLLLNTIVLKIKLIRSKPEFCLLGGCEFKVVLEKISLFTQRDA